MFKAWFKKRELMIAISRWLPNIEEQTFTEAWVKEQCKWALESKAREEVLKYVETEIDKEICRKIAQDLLKDFDYKPVLEKAMIEKFEGYVKGTVAPPMTTNNQALLLQNAYRPYSG